MQLSENEQAWARTAFQGDDFWYNDMISSNEEEDNEIFPEKSAQEEVAELAATNPVTHTSIADLLKRLKRFHPDLPTDPASLNKATSLGLLYDNLHLKLQLNIDGVPLFKSSNIQFWPILGRVKEIQMKDLVIIGLYCGSHKPTDVNTFFEDFVKKMINLEQGFRFGEFNLKLFLGTLCCDTPARAFAKNTKGHTGYSACDRCWEPGVHQNYRMFFPSTAARKRTDEEFLDMADKAHHMSVHPVALTKLKFGMVTGDPIDYMHCVCLGVTRRLIHFWMKTPGPVECRISARTIEVLSEKLISMSRFIPCEFARKPRSLKEVDRWKATEYRQFLLYKNQKQGQSRNGANRTP